MRSPDFGWSYPPGAANDPYAPYNQDDDPCAVCGQSIDDCICPECPICGGIGDPACYDGAVRCSWCGTRPASDRRTPETCASCWSCDHFGIKRTYTDIPTHGMVRSFGQVALLAQVEAQWRAEAEAEDAGIGAYLAEQELIERELQK